MTPINDSELLLCQRLISDGTQPSKALLNWAWSIAVTPPSGCPTSMTAAAIAIFAVPKDPIHVAAAYLRWLAHSGFVSRVDFGGGKGCWRPAPSGSTAEWRLLAAFDAKGWPRLSIG